MTNPTNARIPLTETAAEVAKEVNNKHNKSVLFTLIPRDEAYSSPIIIKLISLDLYNRNNIEIKIIGILTYKCSHLVDSKPPINQ